MERLSKNKLQYDASSIAMYIDMNSFFASCEQQEREELRGRPIGVCPFASPTACVIAPSVEAKRYGVKTGMRLNDCKVLCPDIIPVSARPVVYRSYHLKIMQVLQKYCDDVMPKSIDEAVMNFSSYRLVYKDFIALAKQIKEGIREACGEYVKCSIGIAPNAFLAKLGTEIQKPDGLVQITPENIDSYLERMKLTDLPGIATRNERRLQMIGIRNPKEMRHASPALLRKAFGGVVGNYWHYRLNFIEVDYYKNNYRAMSAMRTVSREQRESRQALESLLISLCTRLEQRLVKQEVFCREVSFFIKYKDYTGWDTKIKFAQPTQDAMEMRSYILQRIREFEQMHGGKHMFNKLTQSMGVAVQNFVSDEHLQYTLFDNRINRDIVRKVMYNIKDQYGKNSVRKASETINPKILRDAIGFGSVKDLYQETNPDKEKSHFNQYLLEED